jgi:hypothetical protein
MQQCHENIVTFLRRTIRIEILKPPIPAKSDIDAILIWQKFYYPDMPDEELVERSGRQHQSIRNARNQKRDQNDLVRKTRTEMR